MHGKTSTVDILKTNVDEGMEGCNGTVQSGGENHALYWLSDRRLLVQDAVRYTTVIRPCSVGTPRANGHCCGTRTV